MPKRYVILEIAMASAIATITRLFQRPIPRVFRYRIHRQIGNGQRP